MIEVRRDNRVIRLSDAHTGFAPDMETHFDAYFNAVEPTFDDGLYVVDFSVPHVHRYRRSCRAFYIPSIAEEDPVTLDYFRHFSPHPTDLVFDLGAYAGVWTVWAAPQVGNIVAFEPDPASLKCLFYNLHLHSISNVTVVGEAVAVIGADMGVAQLFNAEGTPGSAFRCFNGRASFGDTIPVRTLTLTEAVARYGMPDFVKMDIEGAEIEVLESSRALLREARFGLAIDTNHHVPPSTTWTTEPVSRILRECGYAVEAGAPAGFATVWGWKEQG